MIVSAAVRMGSCCLEQVLFANSWWPWWPWWPWTHQTKPCSTWLWPLWCLGPAQTFPGSRWCDPQAHCQIPPALSETVTEIWTPMTQIQNLENNTIQYSYSSMGSMSSMCNSTSTATSTLLSTGCSTAVHVPKNTRGLWCRRRKFNQRKVRPLANNVKLSWHLPAFRLSGAKANASLHCLFPIWRVLPLLKRRSLERVRESSDMCVAMCFISSLFLKVSARYALPVALNPSCTRTPNKVPASVANC